MANRFPLIVNTSANQIQELAAGDNLDLSSSNISNVGNVTVASTLSASTLGGTLSTNAQPNITSVGSLIGLTVSNATGVVNFTTTANVTLGSVSNLHISGGTSGQYLKTDGAGNISFGTVNVSDPMHPFLLSGM